MSALSWRSALTLLSGLVLVACQSTSVRTFNDPEEATAAMVTAAETGDMEEAARIFDTFARSSVNRDRVYAELFDAAQLRYEGGQAREAASILRFVSTKYPGALAAREALVYSLLLERAERAEASEELTRDLTAAVEDVRAATPKPANWVHLAATQAAIDSGDLGRARGAFDAFLAGGDDVPAALLPYVEDIDRYLASH